MNQYKEIAANAGAERLENGMIVGLGSGTTSELGLGLGIPLSTLAEHPHVDVTVDGADEVELGTLNLIKGGGGNLLREKIVATSSARLVIVADESKVVRQLGTHWAVPVE